MMNVDYHHHKIPPISPRYSSHSVFDNIQEFLSNPHETSLKSQFKYLKLYENVDKGIRIKDKDR